MTMRPEQLKRAAEAFIARHEQASAGRVAVLWQRGDEDSDTFASRALAARAKLHHSQLLIVVCGPSAVQRQRGVCVIEMPPVMLTLFSGLARYRGCRGGRGAGRSWAFCRALIARALQERIRILCARELQNSIADSIHTLLSDQISLLGLNNYFVVQNTTILSRNGSEIIFAGLRTNVSKIKSLEGAALVYIEEAAGVSDDSWQTLIPTIRRPGSEIWIAWNPDLETDPTHQRFVVHPPDNAIVIPTTWRDNPWFPEPLQAEMLYLQKVDDDAYRHVWEGECRTHSEAQIFKDKFTVQHFEPQPGWDGPFHGLDLGFAADPSVLTKCWVADNRLYIEKESWGLHVDIDRLPTLCVQIVPQRNYVIRVDSSRPETISYLRAHGFPNCESVEKWKDSVADGIARMRAFEQIVLHPSCTHTIEEFRLYSYKTDRLTGDVLPDVLDRNNHCIDSIRYAIAPLIKQGGPAAFLQYLASERAKDKAMADQHAQHGGQPRLLQVAKARGGTITPLSGGS